MSYKKKKKPRKSQLLEGSFIYAVISFFSALRILLFHIFLSLTFALKTKDSFKEILTVVELWLWLNVSSAKEKQKPWKLLNQNKKK